MSAHREIETLLARYTHAYDLDRLHELDACFTEDAEMSMRIAGGDLVGPFRGREAITKMMIESHEGQDDKRRHVLSNLVIDKLTDSTAQATSYLTLFAVANGTLNLLSTGTYEDELVHENGGWKISKRHIDLDLPY